MTEVFRKYGPALEGAERTAKRAACVVAHPDAGGLCTREAIGEVWSLPFCEVHGREAEMAAEEEMAACVESELEALVEAERLRYATNRILLEAFEQVPVPRSIDSSLHDDAMEAAYPPVELEANTDPDTLAYDYEMYGRDAPYEWWSEGRMSLCRALRQAADRGLPIVEDLELLRERATVQEVLAKHDMDRRWRTPA